MLLEHWIRGKYERKDFDKEKEHTKQVQESFRVLVKKRRSTVFETRLLELDEENGTICILKEVITYRNDPIYN